MIVVRGHRLGFVEEDAVLHRKCASRDEGIGLLREVAIEDAGDAGHRGVPAGVVGQGGDGQLEGGVVGSGAAEGATERRLRGEGSDGGTNARALLEEIGDDAGPEIPGGAGHEDGGV